MQRPDLAMFYTGAHEDNAVRSISLSLKPGFVLEESCPELQNSEPDLQAEAPALLHATAEGEPCTPLKLYWSTLQPW